MSGDDHSPAQAGAPSGWDKIHFERALAETLMMMDVLHLLIEKKLVTREQVVHFAESNQAILERQGMENGVSWLDGFKARFANE